MTTEVWVALIGVSAALLGVALVVVLVVTHWGAIGKLLERTTRVSAGGVVLEFAAKKLQNLEERSVPASVSDRLRDRAERLSSRTKGMRLLWVDDTPSNNSAERRFLRAAGVTVVNATSTQEALAALADDDWDLVITNFRRDGDTEAGIRFQREAEAEGCRLPFLGYVWNAHPGCPGGFFAVVDGPEALIDHVLDLADRRA